MPVSAPTISQILYRLGSEELASHATPAVLTRAHVDPLLNYLQELMHPH